VDRDQVEQPVFEARRGAELRLADPGRTSDDGIEYRGKLAGRAVDDLQHLGGRGLLRQRFVAFGGALVEFSLEGGNCLPMIDRPVVQRCHLIASSTQMQIAHVLRARIPVRHSPRQQCCALLGLHSPR
jgi:hypothetical protein